MSKKDADYKNIERMYFKLVKKEKRSHRRKLPNYRWVIFVSAICILLFTLSFIAVNIDLMPTYICAYIPKICKQNKEWLSNALISMSCGGITGLILYFLSNVRSAKQRSLSEEYPYIADTCNALRCILLVLIEMALGEQTVFDEKALISLLNDLEKKRNRIPLEVYDVISSVGYDPLDCDNMNSYRDRINLSNDEDELQESVIYIMKELKKALIELGKLEQEREDQMEILKRSIF